MRLLWRGLRYTIVVLFLATVAAGGYLYWQRDKILDAVLAQVNEHLEAKVKVQPPQVNIFKHFPKVAVTLNQALVYQGEADTIAAVRQLELLVNPWEYILKRKINVDALHLVGVRLYGQQNVDNEWNFEIWKQDTSATSESSPSSSSISLRNIYVEDALVTLLDSEDKLIVKGYLAEGKISTEVSDTIITSQLSLQLQHLEIDGERYFNTQRLAISSTISTTTSFTQIVMHDLAAECNASKLKCDAVYDVTANQVTLTKAKGDIAATDVKEFAPTLANDIQPYGSDLTAQVWGDAKVSFGAQEDVELTCKYLLNNAIVPYEDIKLRMNKANGSLAYTTNRTATLEVEHFVLRAESYSKMEGKASFVDFLRPKGTVTLKVDAHLIDGQKLLKPLAVEQPNGILTGTVELSLDKALVNVVEAKLELKDLSANYTLLERCMVSRCNSTISLDKNNLHIRSLNGYINGSAFSGELTVYNYLHLDNYFKAKGQLHFDHIDAEDYAFEPQPPTAALASQSTNNSQYLLDFDVELDTLLVDEIDYHQLSLKVKCTENNVYIPYLNMNFCGGNLSGNARYQYTRDGSSLAAVFSGERVDTKRLFSKYKNFDQDVITDKCIAGNISFNNMKIRTSFDPEMNIDYTSMNLDGDIELLDAQLDHVPMLVELGDFLHTSNLDQIQARKTATHVSVVGGKLSLPSTKVESSAVDFNIVGSYNFDESLDYKVRVNATQLLRGKRKDYENEYGNVEVDSKGGLWVHLTITGTTDDPIIAYDKAALKDDLKTGIKRELDLFKVDKQPDKQKPVARDDYEVNWE